MRIRMLQVSVVAATLALSVTLMGVQPAAAFPHNFFAFSPSSGPPGTAISVSGLCNESFMGTLPPTVGSGATHALVGLANPANVPVAIVSIPIGGDGHTWAGQITVPLGSASGQYELAAGCYRDDGTSSGDYPYDIEFFQVLGSQSATVAVSSSANPSQFSQQVSITAAVSGAAGTPTGNVQFSLDGQASAPVALGPAGTAVFQPPSGLSVGNHQISVAYVGDGTYAPSAGSLTQVVNVAATSIGFVSGPSSVAFGQPANFGVAVTFSAPGSGMPPFPSGQVTLVEGASTLAIGTVDPSTGTATLTENGLPPGPYVITASFNNTGYGSSAASTTLTVTSTSSTSVAASPNPALPGHPVTLTATVSAIAPATGTPTGIVSFAVDGTVIGPSVSLTNGKAMSVPISNLTAGRHVISATYSGFGTTYSTSIGYGFAVVKKGQPALSGDPVHLSFPNLRAHLTYLGAPLSGLTLKFSTPGGQLICSGSTDATGTAVCPGGTQAVLALGYQVKFGGNQTYKAASAVGSL